MNTSVNNRKYLTSTGQLLNSLKAEDQTNTNLYQSPPHNTPMSSQQHQHHQQQPQMQAQYQQQHHYQQQQNFNNFGNPNLQFQANSNFLNQQQNQYLATQNQLTKSSSQLISQVATNNNQMDYFQQMKMQQLQSVSNLHQNQMHTSKWPKQQKPSHIQQQQQVKQSSQHLKQPSSKKQPTPNPAPSTSSSTVAELPETFGLPSNNSSSKLSHSKSKSSLAAQTAEILIDENLSTSVSSTATKAILSPKAVQNGTSDPTTLKQVDKSNTEIEIISESSSSVTSVSNNHQNSSANEEIFKNYLSKNYNAGSQVATGPKSQSNFISNCSCINQMLNQLTDSKTDYFENKLKRCKPYSNVKPKEILELQGAFDLAASDDDDETEEGEDNDDEENDKKKQKRLSKLKDTRVIVIDDTNEEMHKPWITADLIKLIKHRNLLQSKITENNLKATTSEEIGTGLSKTADDELIKKFKNLRNKVTKLVKKARKDYLVKYVQENKSKAAESAASNVTGELSAQNSQQNLLKSTDSNETLLTTPSSSHTNLQSSTSTTSTNLSTISSTNNQTVNEITSKLTSSILSNPNTLMTTMYTTYYNQYMKQYQEQQQQAQSLTTDDKSKPDGSLTELQKQAAYYAQQQRTIQTQLEASLTKTAEQLIQEIANLAADKASQPIVQLNQFTHQQHHLHHYQPMSHYHTLPSVPITMIPPTQVKSMNGVQSNIFY